MQNHKDNKEITGLNRITKKRIMELCKKDKLYQTPELNDVLYLHYQGFECIECLEDYTELKCLWLECNAISEIQGLEKQAKLKCLFLQSNLIRKIENLDFCKELDTINLSQNHIRKIENCGFEVLPVLNTLNLSSNYIKDCEGLRELENCKNLSVLDLSNNRIDDILVVKIFGKMQELKVLVLQGNPVVSKIPQYRKTLILECKKLTYLDSRPVFPKDRACAEAWKRGGYEEERKENERWNRRERKKMRDGVNATIKLRNKNRKPEDQLTLIPSSDSEDESGECEKKKNLKNCVTLDGDIDSMWDEVAEDIQSERSSISVTSAESKISDSEKVVTEIERKKSDECKISKSEEGEKVVALKEQKESDENMVTGDKQSERSFSSSTTSESNITHSIQSLECGNKEEQKKERQEHEKSVNDQQKSQSEEHISEKQENMEISKESLTILETERKAITSLTNLNENKDSREQNQIIREIKVKATKSENSLEPPTKKVILQIENCEGLENSSEKINDTTVLTSQDHKTAQKSELYHDISMLKEKETISLKVQDPSTDKLQLPIENCKGLYQSTDNTIGPRLGEDIKHVESQLNHVGVLKQETPKSADFPESSSKTVQPNIENYKERENFNVSETSENYETTIEAIRNLSKSEDSSESLLNKNNEILNTTVENEESNEDNYEALEEMEEAMNILKQESKDLNTNFLKHKRDVKKTLEELETKEERLKVNERVKTDFEELSTNLNNFVEQLDQEQKERQEVFKALFNKDMKPKESSEEVSESEESEHLEESKLESMIKQWDEETRLKRSPTKILLEDKEQLGEKAAAAEIEENLKDLLGCSSANIAKISDTQPCEENKVKSCSTFSEYIPMDISLLTRQSNEALNSLERESKELKRLLQQLEDKNEDLFRDINAETKCEREKNIAENEGNGKEILEKRTLEKPNNETENKDLISEIKCEKEQGISERNQDFVGDLKAEIKCDRENRFPQQQGEVETEEAGKNNKEQSFEENYIEANFKELKSKLFKENVEENKDQPQIVQTIVEELLKTVELKQKSYEFPECLECPEDLNTETQPPKQTITSSLPEFAESFKQFYKDIENKNQEKLNLFDDKEKQKSAVLKELTKHTNLKQFNNDSLESLNAQLSEIKRVEHAKVRRMVDRVYAQKDRYNDTLELVDGKLMVRHRDTQELRELPQAVVQDSTDSEVDYDTAESGEEERDRDRSSKIDKRLKRKPFKPTARKSSEELIVQALIANKSNKTSDDSEESNDDEFYSLDPQDPGNLYKEIDKEFFHKLTLDHVKLSQLDENHVVQCARSYEELKHGLRLNKEERGFTKEENELMDSMIERKFLSVNENPGNLRETLQSKSDQKAEVQLWLNKEKDLDEIELKSNTEFDREKDLEDFESNEAESLTNTPKAKSENLMKQILLKKLAEQKGKLQNENIFKREKPEHEKKDRESILNYERQSEEEKNEIESNIDFENGASNAKMYRCPKQELKDDELDSEQLNTTDELIRDKDDVLVEDNSPGVELMECNLEIIGCNDELVDTIIVNAEVHF